MIHRSIPAALFAITICFLISCTNTPKGSAEADSLAIADTVPAYGESTIDGETIGNLTGSDSLFYVLARQTNLVGTFVGVTVVTESLVEIRKGQPSRNLIAALIQTGEGDYSGIHDDQTWATIHSILCVFELKDDYQPSVVAFADMGDTGGSGTKLSSIEGEGLKLSEDREAALIHTKSSESGAGDYGSRKDDASIYILLNDVVTLVLQTTLEDYQFTSDEQTSTAEQTITTQLSVLEHLTNGLFDLSLVTTTVRTGTEEEDSKKSNDSNIEEEPVTYTWNGVQYERSKGVI